MLIIKILYNFLYVLKCMKFYDKNFWSTGVGWTTNKFIIFENFLEFHV